MLQRVLTVIVWGLVGWSAVALGLRLWPGTAPSVAPLAGLSPPSGAMEPAAADRLFGAVAPIAAAAPTDTRFKLIGVAAPRAANAQSHQGVALLSIDDGPPRAVRVGQWVDGETQLLAVTARTADLGRDGVVRAQLRLEAPPPASTGSLGPTAGISAAPPMPTPMPAPSAGQLPLRGGNPSEVPMPGMPQANTGAQGAGDEAGPQRRVPGAAPRNVQER